MNVYPCQNETIMKEEFTALWKNYSINPLERIMIIHDDELSSVRCLYCGRILRSKYQLCNNDVGYPTCPCGYENHFEPIDAFLWEVRLSMIEFKELE